ncbi:MAG: TonB-dependent receptor domain-containing protein, partial [Thiohalorhabdaceae bacterium]
RQTVRDWTFGTDAYAAYVSDTIHLLGDRLAVTPGLRYEDVAMDYTDNLNDSTDTNATSEVLPGLTIGYDLSRQVFLFANAQRSLVP